MGQNKDMPPCQRGTVSAPGGHLCPDLENGNENVIKPRRVLSCRYPVNCVVVQPERYGNVTNRSGLRHPAAQHHGRRAEAGGKAA